MKALLLTLGHNSSAIAIQDGKVLAGYENERLSGIKSDSRFPAEAIRQLGFKPDFVYATHWSPDGILNNMASKYWQPGELQGLPVRSHSLETSHHDTHIYGALAYAGKNFPRRGSFGVVVDGFGTFGEHFSIYDLSEPTPKLLRRIHGYGTSLGLFYQYTTAFLGMKMHEDEYKLLGYETKVPFHLAPALERDADELALQWMNEINRSIYGSKFDPLYNLDALGEIKQKVFDILNTIRSKYQLPEQLERPCIAFFAQTYLEACVVRLLSEYNPTNLLLSGGVFYNVKLNKELLELVPGVTCVYPLAGDQGNAIGLYAKDHPQFEFPPDLFWGHRTLRDVGKVPGLSYAHNDIQAFEMLYDELEQSGIVNLVRGSMEFGPRALCNTTTLARPRRRNVDTINMANDRNTVMPMAPVVTQDQYLDLFRDTFKVHKSQAHMIVALRFKQFDPSMDGIMHEYKWPYHHHTGRPQVTSDPLMTSLLEAFGTPLINTSFNHHGSPICWDIGSVVANHMSQRTRIKTVVLL